MRDNSASSPVTGACNVRARLDFPPLSIRNDAGKPLRSHKENTRVVSSRRIRDHRIDALR
jgi:hypothetical protein